jgi:signal transduction histidine kinase
MSLRAKLLATYLVLVAALAALGTWSAWRLEQAGAVSQRILSENYESVVAAQNMNESLERQDSAALFAALGRTERAQRQLQEHRRRFDAAFERAAGNITEPGEPEVINDIRNARDEYYRGFDEHADYFDRLEPRFDRLRSAVDRLLQLNQTAMLRKSADANRTTVRSILWTIVLSAALVIAGVGFAVRLSAQIDRDAERLKTEFVGTASHELRTPLTTLQMGIELLNEQIAPQATARHREILAMCREDAARLERLVSDLLDLSKIESGRMKPVLTPIAADTLVRTALEPSRPRIEAGGIALELTLDPDLPQVLADASQIERVIANLVSNAVNATPRGGRITVAVRRADDHVDVSVGDTGRGIPPEYLPRLFNKFTQVPGSPTGSAGLGLAISQQIVRAHGGDIRAVSERGAGSTFTFALPIAGRAPTPHWKGLTDEETRSGCR